MTKTQKQIDKENLGETAKTRRPETRRSRDNNTNISSSTTDKRPHNPTSRHRVEAEMKIEEKRTE